VSFEPLPDAFAKLYRRAHKDPLWECKQFALGEKDAQVRINVSGNSVSSSVLPLEPRAERAAPDSAYVGTCQVPMARLDSIATSILTPADRVHLKMDVQGYELEVLQGAAETLPRIMSVEAEMSLVPLYEGQALMADLVNHLGTGGFRLVWIERGFLDPRTGFALQVDGLFLRLGKDE
jgi:FkbM family methyltransferase